MNGLHDLNSVNTVLFILEQPDIKYLILLTYRIYCAFEKYIFPLKGAEHFCAKWPNFIHDL